jgi:DNA polymerase III subunit epsilon
MEFIALDVETANADMSSICQIGIARYRDRTLIEEWKTFVDPDDYFDGINISIHGITPRMVKGAPFFSDLERGLKERIKDTLCVCHTHFDRVAIHQAFAKYEISLPTMTWLDSARVARRAWEECAWGGYGLSSVCELIGYSFQHHDALEDAKAAAHIIFAAIEKTGIDLDEWLKRVNQPIDLTEALKGSTREGNPEGPLHGESMVFTGSLTIPRREAADLAAQVGCDVTSGVGLKTTILVVGDQDLGQLHGHDKSTKHRKAEELIKQGRSIRIMRETDFRELVSTAGVTL